MIRSHLITIGVSVTAITAALFTSACKLPERNTTLNRHPGVASSPNPTCLPIGSPACGGNPSPVPEPVATATPSATPAPTPTPTPAPTVTQTPSPLPPPVVGAPALYFSDIVSGPKTGIGDGLGSGTIVTIWGAGLGSSQGNSQIYVGGVPAAHVYYWGNADRSGASGPADLYTYHRIQTVSFSVAAAAVDGLGEISVTVNGLKSNPLPFTVRSGNTYFVKTTGVDAVSGGAWSSPWKTLTYVGNGAGGKLKPGDTVYVVGDLLEPAGFPVKYLKGTLEMPFAAIAYPGAKVTIQGNFGIGHHNRQSAYWHFSKFTVKTKSTGIDTFKGMRAVGNEITNYPGGCADGQGGAIAGGNFVNAPEVVGGTKAFGNYIHDFGCDTTSKLHHVFYITNRSGLPIEAFELGWNYLTDNKAHHALHVYDEGVCGDFTGTVRVHDNVVINQVGVGVGVASAGNDPCFTMPVEIYNNLFMGLGKEVSTCSGHTYAIGFASRTNHSHIKLYNNTFYGYGQHGSGFFKSSDGAYGFHAGILELKNNIVVDTNNLPYEHPYLPSLNKAPDVSSHNLWFSMNDPMRPAPSWDLGAITDDPLFTDAANSDFTLKPASPALGSGLNTNPMVIRDLLGIPRGASGSYSIGAFE